MSDEESKWESLLSSLSGERKGKLEVLTPRLQENQKAYLFALNENYGVQSAALNTASVKLDTLRKWSTVVSNHEDFTAAEEIVRQHIAARLAADLEGGKSLADILSARNITLMAFRKNMEGLDTAIDAAIQKMSAESMAAKTDLMPGQYRSSNFSTDAQLLLNYVAAHPEKFRIKTKWKNEFYADNGINRIRLERELAQNVTLREAFDAAKAKATGTGNDTSIAADVLSGVGATTESANSDPATVKWWGRQWDFDPKRGTSRFYQLQRQNEELKRQFGYLSQKIEPPSLERQKEFLDDVFDSMLGVQDASPLEACRKACLRLGISRETVMDWAENQTFKEAFNYRMEIALKMVDHRELMGDLLGEVVADLREGRVGKPHHSVTNEPLYTEAIAKTRRVTNTIKL